RITACEGTAAVKPAFRSALRHRRCLLPADGFYEWVREGGRKQPYFFHLREGGPFAFAGLWEEWVDPEGEVIESCAVLTTEANGFMRRYHDRMPLVLDPKDYALW